MLLCKFDFINIRLNVVFAVLVLMQLVMVVKFIMHVFKLKGNIHSRLEHCLTVRSSKNNVVLLNVLYLHSWWLSWTAMMLSVTSFHKFNLVVSHFTYLLLVN